MLFATFMEYADVELLVVEVLLVFVEVVVATEEEKVVLFALDVVSA